MPGSSRPRFKCDAPFVPLLEALAGPPTRICLGVRTENLPEPMQEKFFKKSS